MKKVFIQFLIKTEIIDIGEALLNENEEEITLTGKRKHNRIVIPRAVLSKNTVDPENNVKKRRGRQKKVQFQEEDKKDLSISNIQSQHETKKSSEDAFLEISDKNKTEEWDDELEFDGEFDESENNIPDFQEDMEDEEEESVQEQEGEEDDLNISESFPKKMTKRQQMSKLKQTKDGVNEADESLDVEYYHMQLPDKKPRKKRNLLLTEEQQIKKLEKEEKRKINTLKQIEEHKQQTVDKILNEAGRMQKQRKEKEELDAKNKNKHNYKKLPSEDIIIKYVSNKNGEILILDKTIPSGSYLLNDHDLSFYGGSVINNKNIQRNCFSCGKFGQYKMPKLENTFFCGVDCFKNIGIKLKELKI